MRSPLKLRRVKVRPTIPLDMDPKVNKELYEEADEEGVRFLLKSGVTNTSMHGLPRVFKASSPNRRIFWLIVLLVGLGVMIWQVCSALIKYFSWPTETTISVESFGHIIMPAITICNLNPMKQHSLQNLQGDHRLNTMYGQGTTTPKTVTDPSNILSETFEDTNQETDEDYDYGREDDDYTDRTIYQSIVASLSREDRIKVGHKLKDMLVECSFNGAICSARNFSIFTNHIYGNCYTFNTFDNDAAFEDTDIHNLLYITRVGPLYGLDITLYVEQGEYISLSQEAGIRVLVHDQRAPPFPEDHGFSAATGQTIYVGITMTEYQRASPPYGKCGDYTQDKVPSVNMYVDYRKYLSYNYQACKKTCYQRKVIEECGCGDPHHPLDAAAFMNLSSSEIEPCHGENQTTCRDGVHDKYSFNLLTCSDTEECPQSCREFVYSTTISTATWPSEVKQESIIEQLEMEDEMFNNLDLSEKKDRIRSNYLRMKVFFDDIAFNLIKTSNSYKAPDLFGSVGGLIGLYMGLSIITIVEFVELFVDICCMCCGMNTRKKDIHKDQNPNSK